MAGNGGRCRGRGAAACGRAGGGQGRGARGGAHGRGARRTRRSSSLGPSDRCLLRPGSCLRGLPNDLERHRTALMNVAGGPRTPPESLPVHIERRRRTPNSVGRSRTLSADLGRLGMDDTARRPSLRWVALLPPGVTMAHQPSGEASPPRRLTVVPPHPDAPAPPPPAAATRETPTRDFDAGNKAALVHAAYAAGDLTTEQAVEMIAALPGREETTAEYGWRRACWCRPWRSRCWSRCGPARRRVGAAGQDERGELVGGRGPECAEGAADPARWPRRRQAGRRARMCEASQPNASIVVLPAEAQKDAVWFQVEGRPEGLARATGLVRVLGRRLRDLAARETMASLRCSSS